MDKNTTISSPVTNALLLSRYNFFVRRSEGVVGYNARTGTFALLSERVADCLLGTRPIWEIPEGDRNFLQEMGFLHDGNELALVKQRLANARNAEYLGLTILPTLACNFSCHYCFQNDYRAKIFMSPVTQDATVQLAVHLVRHGRRNVYVTWFGGEPLLAKDIILSMSERLKEAITAAGGTLHSQAIVTNGTMLDEETTDKLVRAGVSFAQVSFDALVYSPSRARGIVDEHGDPSPILVNVLKNRKKLRIVTRINVSQGNQTHIPRIIEILTKHGLQDSYVLARADDSHAELSCSSMRKGEESAHKGSRSLPVLSSETFSLSRADYSEMERETFLRRPEGVQAMIAKLTPKQGEYCGATAGTMFVVDPVGDISNCWMSAGQVSESIGNVCDLMKPLNEAEIAKRWRLVSPFAYPACESCNVLPLCMGGCSHSRVVANAQLPPCESIRHQVTFCVEQIGGRMQLPEL